MSRTYRRQRQKDSYYRWVDFNLETKPGRHYGDRHITRMEHLSARVFRDVCRGDWSDVRGNLRLGRALRICSKHIIRQELAKLDLKEGGESHDARDG